MAEPLPPGISVHTLGPLPEHQPDHPPVHEYTLCNGGLRLSAMTWGGIVTRLWVPDRDGRPANVVLGFDRLADYVAHNPNFGTLVGRYANRIAGACFTLDGEAHALSANNGAHCLHGGAQGFGKRLWRAEPVAPAGDGSVALRLHLVSEHGDQGFPGRLEVCVQYSLTTDGCWCIDYQARTDRATVVNLSHHGYFNLAGGGSAMGHRLMIAASRYTEVDEQLIPTTLADVAGTPFDFRQPVCIDSRLREGHAQLVRGRGYDHNWLLDGADDGGGLHLAAQLSDPASGRTMAVHTSAPALQFYSGNQLDGRLVGTGGQLVRQGDGLCLETQHSPDSPHHAGEPGWPSTVLRPGQVWRSRTEHHFGVD